MYALFALLLSATPCPANDAAVGGSGAAVYPVENTQVRLVRELVVFDEVDKGFAVTADLHFLNPGPAAASLRLGFPSRYLTEGEGDPQVHDLAAWVDGQPAAVNKVQVGPEDALDDWWEEVFLFEAAFPPATPVQLLHSYLISLGGDSMGGSFTQYILRTGEGWAGTIGESRVVFRFQRPPAGLQVRYAAEPVEIVPAAEAPSPRGPAPVATYTPGPTPTLELLFRDFEPSGDVTLYWDGEPFHALASANQRPETDLACGYELLRWYKGVSGLGWSSNPLPGEEVLSCFEPDLLRNLIFASRGYAFSKPHWQQAFQGLFPTSSDTFDAAWLTASETLAVEALKNRG